MYVKLSGGWVKLYGRCQSRPTATRWGPRRENSGSTISAGKSAPTITITGVKKFVEIKYGGGVWHMNYKMVAQKIFRGVL